MTGASDLADKSHLLRAFDRPASLATARLTMRELGPADAPFILALTNDEDWLASLGDRGARTVADAEALIETMTAAALWLVVSDPSGRAVGICGLVDRPGLDNLDLGYAVAGRHAGRGYATEAAAAMLAHARHRLPGERLLAIVSPTNAPSRRVLSKIGMRCAGKTVLPGRSTAALVYSI